MAIHVYGYRSGDQVPVLSRRENPATQKLDETVLRCIYSFERKVLTREGLLTFSFVSAG